MRSRFLIFHATTAYGIAVTATLAQPEVRYLPLSFGGVSEFGSLRSGRYGNNPPFRGDWVDHFGAYITQSAAVGDHLAFHIGLGGLFEFQKREVVEPQWGGTQYKSFSIGPTTADLEYRASPDGRGAGFTLGLFPYKYDADAADLGEYLFRSGPYPTYILGGGYAFVDDAQAQLQGAKISFARGGFSADALAFMETGIPSLYDITFAAIAKYRTAGGLLELGAGALAKHAIPIHPDRTRLNSPVNAYFEKGGRTFTGQAGYYSERGVFYAALARDAGQAGRSADSARYAALAAAWKADGDSVRAWIRGTDASGNPVPPPDYHYYTQAGILLMAEAALDPKAWIAWDRLGPRDLRLYAEAALLGVQDYPIFYENRRERMPVMVGFNFPAFRLLDRIALQAQYFPSRELNSYLELGASNAAIPTQPLGADRDRSRSAYNDMARRNDWYWSVLLEKELVPGATFSAQFARDHIRTVSVDSWFGPGLEPTEVLGAREDWYWMARFAFGI